MAILGSESMVLIIKHSNIPMKHYMRLEMNIEKNGIGYLVIGQINKNTVGWIPNARTLM